MPETVGVGTREPFDLSDHLVQSGLRVGGRGHQLPVVGVAVRADASRGELGTPQIETGGVIRRVGTPLCRLLDRYPQRRLGVFPVIGAPVADLVDHGLGGAQGLDARDRQVDGGAAPTAEQGGDHRTALLLRHLERPVSAKVTSSEPSSRRALET